MKTIDKSKLFKRAWTLIKKMGMTMSAALKLSWAKAKQEIIKAYSSFAMPRTTLSFDEANAFCMNELAKMRVEDKK